MMLGDALKWQAVSTSRKPLSELCPPAMRAGRAAGGALFQLSISMAISSTSISLLCHVTVSALAQWVQCLLCQYEDLSSDSQAHVNARCHGGDRQTQGL